MSKYYAKLKENPCVGTDASTPFTKTDYLVTFASVYFEPDVR